MNVNLDEMVYIIYLEWPYFPGKCICFQYQGWFQHMEQQIITVWKVVFTHRSCNSQEETNVTYWNVLAALSSSSKHTGLSDVSCFRMCWEKSGFQHPRSSSSSCAFLCLLLVMLPWKDVFSSFLVFISFSVPSQAFVGLIKSKADNIFSTGLTWLYIPFLQCPMSFQYRNKGSSCSPCLFLSFLLAPQ